jgi:hypothetical protein
LVLNVYKSSKATNQERKHWKRTITLNWTTEPELLNI